MFYVPFIAGTIVGGGISWPVGWLFIATSALFISRESLLRVWRRRTDHAARVTLLVHTLIGAIGGVVLLLCFHFYLLLWLALPGMLLLLVNGWQASRRADRTISTEILAIAALTLSAPAAHYVAGGHWNVTTWLLWGLSFLYFASSVFYVRYRVTSLHGRDPEVKRRVSMLSLLYHLLLPIILVIIIVRGDWSSLLLAAFLPIIVRALFHHLRPPATLNLKQIGLREIAYAVIFLILTVAGMS